MIATKPTNGVAPRPRAGNWLATITHAGRRIRLGTFDTLEQAVAVYIRAATELGHRPADDIRDAIAAWANADPLNAGKESATNATDYPEDPRP